MLALTPRKGSMNSATDSGSDTKNVVITENVVLGQEKPLKMRFLVKTPRLVCRQYHYIFSSRLSAGS
jgi:hypothetical protein